MEFIKVEDSKSKHFKESWKIYNSSFPSDEKRDVNMQVKLFDNATYSFYSVYEGKILVGIIAYWKFEDFLFVEHLAIKENCKGKGLGTMVLKKFINEKNGKIVVEVERPKTKIAQKRIGFYERAGFQLNKYGYIQPPYSKDKNPVPMFLMSFPKKIDESEFLFIRKMIHSIIYGLKRPLVDGQNYRKRH